MPPNTKIVANSILSYITFCCCLLAAALACLSGSPTTLLALETQRSYLDACVDQDNNWTTFPFRQERPFDLREAETRLNSIKKVQLELEKSWPSQPNCLPDTFYRWTSAEEVQHLKRQFSKQGSLADFEQKVTDRPASRHALYLWRSPLWGFAYGPVSYRLKIKKTTKIKPMPFHHIHERPDDPKLLKLGVQISVNTRDCQNLAKFFDIHNTIFAVRIKRVGGYHEYRACSWAPFASISFDTNEHLEEMKRELSQMRGGCPGKDFDMITNWNPETNHFIDLHRGFELDNRWWGLEVAESRVRDMVHRVDAAAKSAEKLIFFSHNEPQSRSTHFETDVAVPF